MSHNEIKHIVSFIRAKSRCLFFFFVLNYKKMLINPSSGNNKAIILKNIQAKKNWHILHQKKLQMKKANAYSP